MNKEKIKQIVLDIIAEIAPDEDLSEGQVRHPPKGST